MHNKFRFSVRGLELGNSLFYLMNLDFRVGLGNKSMISQGNKARLQVAGDG